MPEEFQIDLNGITDGKTNYNFQKLTPTSDVDLDIYKEALNFVFDNDDIRNVAISGAYGSGKSSIIDSYKRTHPNDHQFIHISLVNFESSAKSNTPEEVIRSSLEGKILNRLIHQIDSSKIPRTNFSLKGNESTRKPKKIAAMVMALAILTLYVIRFDNWCNFFFTSLNQPWLKWAKFTTAGIFRLVAGFLCTGITGYFLYSMINILNGKNFIRKLSFQGNEIELEKNNDAYFDKYLNEVLYLFENSGVDVIVFEDFDRYNNIQIFRELRDINNLIKQRGKKTVRFFYLVRDDLFESKDRTKFFDFIIPIVPIVDSSNSYDHFIEFFKQGGLLDKFDKHFLQGLSLYIDDMRTLKNIYNEYLIYLKRIQSTDLSSDKLLALIAYKNIFPGDFSELQLGRGYVHALFNNKSKIRDPIIKEVESPIRQLKQEIDSLNGEMLSSIEELDALYFNFNHEVISVGEIPADTYNTRSQLIRAMKENQTEVDIYDSRNRSQIRTSEVASHFEKMLQNPEYLKRKDIIEAKANGQIEKLKGDIKQLEQQKTVLQNARLHEILGLSNLADPFNVITKNEVGEENRFDSVKGSPYFGLVKYLIRNKFIDESYPDYMTYFYENRITERDKKFLRSIMDWTPKEYTYSLDNPKEVLTYLRPVDFECEAVLNFDLLSCLLENRQSNRANLERFFGQLSKTKNFNFIREFLEICEKKCLFIELLNHFWPDVFQGILNESNFTDDDIKKYAVLTLYYSPDSDILELNNKGVLSSYISNNPTFLNIAEPKVDKIITRLSLINARFTWIDYEASNTKLFDAVYKNSLYQMTFELISLMLETKYNLSRTHALKTRNFTLISSKPNEPLGLYVINNFNTYLGIVLENCGDFIDDEESVALRVLNNSEIELDNKKKYIQYLKTKIERIQDVKEEELWGILLEQETVYYSVENIISYYRGAANNFDEYLIRFINSSDKDLSFNYDLLDKEFGEGFASEFYNAIVTCNELSNERYEKILESFGRYYDSFAHKEIDGDKIVILIKQGVVSMTSDNLLHIRAYYPEQLMTFITAFISEYIAIVSDENLFDYSEMLLVLEESVSYWHKIKLLSYYNGEVSVQGKTYTSAVKNYILEHHFAESDIPLLLAGFPKESDEVKQIIKRKSIEYVEKIIEHKYPVPFELLVELFAEEELTIETKKTLLANALAFGTLQKSRVKELLGSLGMKEYLRSFEGKRPTIRKSETSLAILSEFRKRRWISKFYPDKKDSSYYRVIGRKEKEDESESS